MTVHRTPWARSCCVATLLLCASLCAARAQSPASVPAVSAPATPAAAASVTGVVVDSDGERVARAHVRTVSPATHRAQETQADEDGLFRFASVPAGQAAFTVSAPGFADLSLERTLAPGANDLGELKLGLVTAAFSVDALTPHQVAEIELKHEEHQRLLGIIPNFGISYDWNAGPMSAGQKYRLATRFTFDPFNLAIAALQAGVEQATGGFSGYGPGPAGFGKRYGAALADFTTDNELGGAVFPALFHQDPRYFWKGRGSVASRTWYAVSQTVLCRGDNGHTQFNVSGISGFLASGAISNIYYPAADRSDAVLTLENAGLGLGFSAIGNVIQEFFLKKLTPNSRDLSPNVSTVARAQTGALVSRHKQRMQ